MRFAFLATHRTDRAPGQRFRFEQYLPHLRAQGITCDHLPLMTERDDRAFYQSGRVVHKAAIAAKSLGQRLVETSEASLRRYNLAFVHKRALFFGGPIAERRIARSNVPLVFDFDDAIWIPNISDANRWFASLKRADNVPKIIGMSDLVIAGNPYLADYAKQYNRNVKIVPTTVDTDEYRPTQRHSTSAQVCIGWSGSVHTIPHFETAVPFLKRIKERFGDRVRFKVIGDASYQNEELGVEGQPWQKATELEDLSDIDVGIMPLPDDEWTRGKCALKGLQYMALEIPTLMSPVGINADIVTDGVDGYLPKTQEEWIERLATLIEDPELRTRMGRAGRKTVGDHYSFRAWRQPYHDMLVRTAVH